MGGAGVAAGQAILAQANIPTFPYPDTAARVFTHMWRYSDNLRALYETPTLTDDRISSSTAYRRPPHRAAGILIDSRSGPLGQHPAHRVRIRSQLLDAYAIPTIDTRVAVTPDEAVAAAEAIGYPVVLKLHSETITHKTDVGGIALNHGRRAGAVRQARI